MTGQFSIYFGQLRIDQEKVKGDRLNMYVTQIDDFVYC